LTSCCNAHIAYLTMSRLPWLAYRGIGIPRERDELAPYPVRSTGPRPMPVMPA
jgi:hypothetical protein